MSSINSESLKTVLGNLGEKDVKIVYAFASWCPYCTQVKPSNKHIFEEQAKNSKLFSSIFLYDASDDKGRKQFHDVTNREVKSFPSIFVFYKDKGTLKTQMMKADGKYLSKFEKFYLLQNNI